MALTDLPFKPGFMTNPPDRGVGMLGYWKNGDKVRFKDGLPEMMGGWVRDNASQAMEGVARGAADWVTLRNEKLIGFGTSHKLYVWQGGSFFDITPVRASSTINNNPFATTDTSAVVVVTDTAHGATDGAFVTFSGAAAVGGITISGEYQLTYINTDSYSITHSSAATSTVAAGGGAAVVAEYQINPGAELSVEGTGWGAGAWGAEAWGTARTVASLVFEARTWTLDLWGEDLIACHADGNIYVWDSSVGTGTRAALIAAAPTNNRSAFVSQESRHLVALGADGDPMMIKWCDSEDYTDWTPTTTNTAGDKRVDTGSRLVRGIEFRNQTLVFTDSALYAMQFIGPPYTFAVLPVGLTGGLMGPNAAVVHANVCYWMGTANFYQYDGVIKPMVCPVYEHVFRDINVAQSAQVWAGVNTSFNEVWWIYCSGDSDQNDRYVIYNTVEQTWVFGTLDRSLYVGDSDVVGAAYAVDPDGVLYYHDIGTTQDGAAHEAFIESGDVEISQGGESFMHVGKMVPDFKRISGEVSATVTTKRYPQASETQVSGPHAMTVDTEFINPRVRGRQMSVKVGSNSTTADWRLGMLRLGLRPHGKR